MLNRIILRNKETFNRYNTFRKSVFSELAPQESELILNLLPWLLSVNHPNCPGYIPDMDKDFRVYNVENEPEIRLKEPAFKRKFDIKEKRSLLKRRADHYLIQGLYTIGSVGTVSQTSSSDCDIWVCYDRQDFDKAAWRQLNQKINLIKDWLDLNTKMPIFFFISEVKDIRNSQFGSLNEESSGTAQKNVLKEEFYRTSIVICGKIPLWWVCFDKDTPVDYSKALSATQDAIFGLYDFIDFGNLERVDPSEHFGAALWQLHKSLRQTLKSITKMTLLKMQLDFPEQPLVCNRFREEILSNEHSDEFPDPMVFAMLLILESYESKHQEDLIEFLKKCFYLRCELKPYGKRHPKKKLLSNDLFKRYPIEIREKIRLSKFYSWRFDDQIELGDQLFRFLIKMYKEVSARHTRVANDIDKQDLQVLGRKILVSYQYKPKKISVLQKPTGQLNLSDLIISLDENRWTIFSGSDKSRLLISSRDIIFNIAFLIWNDLFNAGRIQMEPNPSNVTLQEILNLGKRMDAFFGKSDVSEVDFSNFVKKEVFKKLFITVSFENTPWEKDFSDFSVVYENSWGELFVNRFYSQSEIESFFKLIRKKSEHVETNFYVQRNCTSYEKIIERTKKVLSTLTGTSTGKIKIPLILDI